MLQLVDLHHSGSPGEVPQTDEARAPRDPLTVEHRVVQTLLDVRDDLRLRERRRHLNNINSYIINNV